MNYTRQYRKWLKRNPNVSDLLTRHISQMEKSQYFILPDGGSFVTDQAVQALDDVDLIRLPFDDVVLEYSATPLDAGDGSGDGYDGHEWEYSDKRIVIVKDVGDFIAISGAWNYRNSNRWWQTPFCCVKKEQFLDFGVGNKIQFGWIECPLQEVVMKNKEMTEAANRDIAGEVTIAARFIAALACKNVTTQSVGSSRSASKTAALPYNSYHRLVISGRDHGSVGGSFDDRRQPREHLRRGHIRRLSSGDHIWINSTVVNAGIGGTVHKDYKLAI